MDLSSLEVGLRLGSATLVGGVIGINRDLANKPIGVRTRWGWLLSALPPTAAPLTPSRIKYDLMA